jgi:predicted dehydrogenase
MLGSAAGGSARGSGTAGSERSGVRLGKGSAVGKEPVLRYRPRFASDLGHGIGIIGAGTIVRHAHLPAYRKAGFRVRGLYDVDQGRARQLADEYGVPVYDSVEALMENDEVAVVDVAVPASHQLAIVRKVTAARKHLLCHKPLAESFEDAKEIVRLAEEAGVKLAVNQNSRWMAGVRSSRFLIEDGWIGRPLIGQIEASHFTDWGVGLTGRAEREAAGDEPSGSGALLTWARHMPRLLILQGTVHQLESMRSIFGMPSWVYALHRRDPEQRELGETIALLSFQFESGLIFSIKESARNRSGDPLARFRFEGTRGIIDGTFGQAVALGVGSPDTLRLTSSEAPEFAFEARFDYARYPDAFIATMGELLSAISEDREPEHAGHDNLNLLRLVFAAYRSADENRPVRPEEIS